MVQLYFLSVLCNGLSGYILFSGASEESFEKNIPFALQNPVLYLVMGIVSIVVGVLKLLSPFENRYPFFGDLIPACAGIVAGFALVFGVYRQSSSSAAAEGTLGRLGASMLTIRKPLGAGLLAVAALHFILPQALFL